MGKNKRIELSDREFNYFLFGKKKCPKCNNKMTKSKEEKFGGKEKYTIVNTNGEETYLYDVIGSKNVGISKSLDGVPDVYYTTYFYTCENCKEKNDLETLSKMPYKVRYSSVVLVFIILIMLGLGFIYLLVHY